MTDDIPKLPKAFSATTAVLDKSGKILAVNDTWKMFGQEHGLNSDTYCIGANYLDVCNASTVGGPFLKELKELFEGARSTFARWYLCNEDDSPRRWYVLIGLRNSSTSRVVLSHLDISPVFDANTISDLDAERPDLAFSIYAC